MADRIPIFNTIQSLLIRDIFAAEGLLLQPVILSKKEACMKSVISIVFRTESGQKGPLSRAIKNCSQFRLHRTHFEEKAFRFFLKNPPPQTDRALNFGQNHSHFLPSVRLNNVIDSNSIGRCAVRHIGTESKCTIHKFAGARRVWPRWSRRVRL
jgi:hypothetical protein